MSKDDALPFGYRERYPDPQALFTPGLDEVESILEQAIFALDASALLLPYSTASNAFIDLEATYGRLVEEGRLFVPGHAVREFLVRRDDMIKTLYQQLLDTGSKTINPLNYPMLQGNATYAALQTAQQERDTAQKKVTREATKLAEEVRAWMWNDPVSALYRRVLTPEVIVDPSFDAKAAQAQLEREIKYRLPPGYQDAGKGENAAGDSLVWQTLLCLGHDKKRPLIFATGDAKNDWWIRSGSRPIHPRFELLHAYWTASGGHPIYLMPLAEVLKYLRVTAATVQEVREAAYETSHPVGQVHLEIPDEDVFLYHLHRAQVHLTFDHAQLLQGRTLDLRLELDQGHPEFQDSIDLLTRTLTFEPFSEALLQSGSPIQIGRSVTIEAKGLPSEQATAGQPLKSSWKLIASVDGEEVSSARFTVHLRLLRVEASILPSPIEVHSGGSAPFTVEVRIVPPLDEVQPVSLGNAMLDDTFVEMIEMEDTTLVNGVLRANGRMTFRSLDGGPRGGGQWLIFVGDVFGYRRPHYWTLHGDPNFHFPAGQFQ